MLALRPWRMPCQHSFVWSCVLSVVAFFPVGSSTITGQPTVDELMLQIEKKYKQDDRKYEALADKVEKAVTKALETTVWLSEQEAGKQRMMQEHPFCALVQELSKTSKSGAKSKTPPSPLLAKFPWAAQLELPLGLEYGSDRPIPPNDNGFINLDDAPDPLPGFPELCMNQYLYGLQEIAGWRTGVKLGKTLSYVGRDSKAPAAVESTLPGWEKLRVQLQGSLPDVALFALPSLTHRIHSRLVERRKTSAGELARMDEMLAFLDSKWNGFSLQIPSSKERLMIVQPIHALMTDRTGFMYRFANSAGLARSGDLPFVAVQSYQQYADVFMGQKVVPHEFIARTPAASAVTTRFLAECAYLSRYKALIDQIVRAILSPNLRYPSYIAYADYPEGKMPDKRETGHEFDVLRKQAVMVWAYADKNPDKLADFLHDRLLSKPANQFPNDVGLSASFTLMVRENEKEMLQAITARIEAARKATASGASPKTTDDEREFSPYATYADGSGSPASEYVLNSFHVFHGSVTKLIQDTAFAVVLKEIGK